MARTFTGYKITVTQAYRMEEQGTRYSLDPWGSDTEYYQGYDEAVPITLADGVEPAYSQAELRMLYRAGETRGMDLVEAQSAGWVTIHRTHVPDDWDPERDEQEWERLLGEAEAAV